MKNRWLVRWTRRVLVFGVMALPTTAWAELCVDEKVIASCHTYDPSDKIPRDQGAAPGGPSVPGYVGTFAAVKCETGNKSCEPPPHPMGQKFTHTPGMRLELQAGGWGQGAQEPMAFARVHVQFAIPPGDVSVRILPPDGPNNVVTNYQYPCEEGTALCVGGKVHQTARMFVQRSYRITQTSATTFAPSDQIPVVVDYKILISSNFSGQEGFLATGTASVELTPTSNGMRPSTNSSKVICKRTGLMSCNGGTQSLMPDSDGLLRGSLRRSLGMNYIGQKILLSLTAFAQPLIDRKCNTAEAQANPDKCALFAQTQAGITVVGESMNVVADPFVYIDPTWKFASEFKLEVAGDETDTTWFVPERTNFDPKTLTFGGDTAEAEPNPAAGMPDGGTRGGTVGTVDGGTRGGTVGTADAGPVGKSGQSGGCSVTTGALGRNAGLWFLPFALGAAIRGWRQRRERRRSEHRTNNAKSR
jgi:hypothetical protein